MFKFLVRVNMFGQFCEYHKLNIRVVDIFKTAMVAIDPAFALLYIN